VSDPPKRREPLAGGSSAQNSTDTANDIADPRIAKDIALRRHADQKAPAWTAPPGWAVAQLLDDLLRRGRK
jgi:hypothetical protein